MRSSARTDAPLKVILRRLTPRRIHPLNVLYLFTWALLVGIFYNVAQAALADPKSALDPVQLQGTAVWHLAITYPLIFWSVSGLLLLANGAGLYHDTLRIQRERSELIRDVGREVDAKNRLPLILAKELRRDTLNLGPDDAASFPYIVSPVRETFDEIHRGLMRASRGERWPGALIFGYSGAGKTRLLLEAMLDVLPLWNVLVWRPMYTLKELPARDDLRGRNLVILLDDLQESAPRDSLGAAGDAEALDVRAHMVQAMLAYVREAAKSVVVIGTCHTEDEVRTSASFAPLFEQLEVVRIPTFSSNAEDPAVVPILTAFRRYHAPFIEDWDGTIGSLLLGLARRKANYLEMVTQHDPGVPILRALKLLRAAEVVDYSERRLKAVCRGVLGEHDLAAKREAWREAVDGLVAKQFVAEEVAPDGELRLLIRTDAYFTGVITDYFAADRPARNEHDLVLLQGVLMDLNDVPALVSLGGVLIRLARYERALAVYDRVTQLDAKHALAWVNRGVALHNLRRYEDALASYERALELDASLARAWNNEAAALLKLERYPEALEACERALALDNSIAVAWCNKAGALLNSGQDAGALEACKRALALDPRLPEAWITKAAILRKLGRVAEALEASQQAIALKPDAADAWVNQGVLLHGFGRFQEALDALDRALRLNPDDLTALSDKGALLGDLGRPDEALVVLNRALSLDPKRATVWNGKAYAVMGALGDHEQALACAERAIELMPQEGECWDTKGDVYLDWQRPDDAIVAFEHAVQYGPHLAHSWRKLGETLYARGRYTDAVAAMDRALAVDPTNQDALDIKRRSLSAQDPELASH